MSKKLLSSGGMRLPGVPLANRDITRGASGPHEHWSLEGLRRKKRQSANMQPSLATASRLPRFTDFIKSTDACLLDFSFPHQLLHYSCWDRGLSITACLTEM